MPRRVLLLPSVILAATGCNSTARRAYHETRAQENRDRLANYANLPFAIGRCGNIGKRESEYLDLNVDDAKRDWYHDRGFHRRFQYEFKSSMEGLSAGRPAKQYARWSTSATAKSDDQTSWPRIKARADEYTKMVGMKLADKPLSDMFKKMLERSNHDRWWVGGESTVLDRVEYMPARITIGRKFPKEGEKNVTVDYDASDENWQRWLDKRKRLEISSIRRYGPTLVLQFKLDQWAEWDDRAWARDEARKFLIVEDIPPFVCTMKSVTGVGTAWGPSPDEREENPDKIVYIEDYGLPRSPRHGQLRR